MKTFFCYKKAIILATTLLITFAVIVANVFALGASPLKVEYDGVAGETIKGQVSVYNSSDEPKYIYLNKADFTYNDDSEEIVYTNTEGNISGLQEWIILPGEPVYVKPKERKVISYEIAIPKEAESKGYYGAIFIESVPVKEGSSISGKFSVKLAHLVLLEVEGSLFEDISLKNLVVSQEHDDSLELQLVMFNNGNVHGSPEGAVEFYDEKGNLVHTMDINSEGDTVMPQHKKTFTARCPFSDLPAGTYYAVFAGQTNEGKNLNAKFVFEITKNNEVILREDGMANFDIDSLRGAAVEKTQTFNAVAGVAGIFVVAVCFAYFLRCMMVCLTNKKACHFWWYKPKKAGRKGKTK